MVIVILQAACDRCVFLSQSDGGEEQAAAGTTRARRAETPADHPQSRDASRGGGGACSTSCRPQQG